MKDLRNVLRHYRSVRRLMVASVAVALGASLAEMGFLLILVPVAQATMESSSGSAIEAISIFEDMSRSGLIATAMVFITTTVVLRVVSVWLAARASAGWQHDQRLQIFSAFQAADWATQGRDRSGKLIAVSGPNINQGASGLTTIAQGIGAVFGLAAMVGGAFLVAPIGALLMIGAGAVLIGLLRPLGRVAKCYQRRLARLNVEISSEVGEWVSFAREVRLFGIDRVTENRLGALVSDQERYRVRAVTLQNTLGPLFQLGGVLLVLAIMWVATQQTSLAASSLATSALLLYRSLTYSQQVQRALHAAQEVTPYLEDLDSDLETYAASIPISGNRQVDHFEQLALNGVDYHYAAQQAALRGVDTELHRGEIVGVVGPSGSGKSTLAQLVLRLRQPTAGSLLLDGVPAQEFDPRSWRSKFALVPQEAQLLHGTVAENIAFLRSHVSDDEVETAARAAGLHDEIMALPDGYDTPVGAATRNLSGGQIQRISIARALAGKPLVIVFDEPTSALDVHSEAIVQDTIECLRHRMLVLIIAHRLTTLSICDRLLVLRDGHLEADGPPDDVMRSHPFFESGALDLA